MPHSPKSLGQLKTTNMTELLVIYERNILNTVQNLLGNNELSIKFLLCTLRLEMLRKMISNLFPSRKSTSKSTDE
jgi:hypothetical protein